MRDPEAVFELVRHAREQGVARMLAGHHETGGELGPSRARRPDVRIVHLGPCRTAGEERPRRRRVDPARYGPARHGVEGEPEARPRPIERGRGYEEAREDRRERVEHRSAGEEDRARRHHHTERDRRIRRHAQKGSTGIRIVPGPRP